MTMTVTPLQILDIHQLIKKNGLLWRLGMIFAFLLLVLHGAIHCGVNMSLRHTERRRLGPRIKMSHRALSLNISIVSQWWHRLVIKHLALALQGTFQMQTVADCFCSDCLWLC